MLAVEVNSIFSNIFGWTLIIGTIFSYIPQYYRIYKKGNSEGISQYMLISGSLSCIFNILGSIQENLNNIQDCNLSKNNNCYEIIMPIIQLFIPGICIYIFYIYFIYYIKNSNRLTYLDENIRIYFNFKVVLIINLLLIIFTILQDTIQFINKVIPINQTGKIYNILSAVFSLFMWIPQIKETYEVKRNASLSILALSIHGAGCGLTVIYQIIYNKQSIFVVLCYGIAFFCEYFIVFMCIYYNQKGKSKNKPEKGFYDAKTKLLN